MGANSDCTKTIAYQTAEGPVSDFIQRYSQQNDNVPWDNLKRGLTTWFADITDAQHAMFVLRRTKQKAAETVQLFSERLLELAEDAWPGQSLTTSTVERQLIEMFVDGISENSIARKIIREGPANLQTTVRVAVNEQNLNTRFALRNREFGSSSMTPRRHEPTKRHETPMEVDKFSGSCFNCGRKGHRATECRRPKQVNAVKAEGKSPFCWDCGKTGHTRQGCPGQRVTDRSHPKTIPKLQGGGGVPETSHNGIVG